MLRFNSLTIEDFGPFKEKQTIDFTNENGVTFIWGDNGRGKTTLLKIFRYALYGRFQNRNGAPVDYTTLPNRESRKEERYGFSVKLCMTCDGVPYELTRQFQVRPGVGIPQTNNDYQPHMFLKQGTTFLPLDEAEHILKTIMPEQVARFFLFDGELLQEYEELLADDTEAGIKIKTSIEEILGVPVLTNGATDTDVVLDAYRKAKNKAAQKDSKTQQTASHIEVAEAKLEEHTIELERMQGLLTEEKAHLVRIEDELRENDHICTLLGEIKTMKGVIADKNMQQETLLSNIVEETKEAWKALVGARVEAVLSGLQEQLNDFEEKENAQKVAKRFLDGMKAAAAQKHCEICGQDVRDEFVERLVLRIQNAETEFGDLSVEELVALRALRARCATLESMRHFTSKDKLKYFEQELDRTIVSISDNERRLKVLEGDVKKYGEIGEISDRIQIKTREHSDCVSKINNLEEGRRAEQDIIGDTKKLLKSLYEILDKASKGAEMEAAKQKVDLCEQIHAIFEEGIASYRDKLKADVERDATELFRKISSDPDYARLKINDNYGLSIIHTSGDTVPMRSAGYEHIVALSLIGALHKNAPLRGPIIMDSPFGRLDPTHKAKITSALPHMSEQIVLLAYTSEIDEQEARRTLGASLKKEYRLTRQTSYHTCIEAQSI